VSIEEREKVGKVKGDLRGGENLRKSSNGKSLHIFLHIMKFDNVFIDLDVDFNVFEVLHDVINISIVSF
jgi:hypothetical protein